MILLSHLILLQANFFFKDKSETENEQIRRQTLNWNLSVEKCILKEHIKKMQKIHSHTNAIRYQYICYINIWLQ